MRKRNAVHQTLMTLLALAVLFSMGSTALAALGAPDLDTKGSLSVTMRDSGTKNTVSGGTLTIYRVARIHIDNADLSYVYTDSFAASGLTLGDLRDSGLAGGLAAYAKDKSLAGTTKTIGTNGVARFEGLSLGLYLVVQNTAASGYYAISPFLVSVPMANSSRTAWIYDVDASPKVQLAQKGPTPSPTATPSPTPTPTPSGSGGGKLPQSGQLNWPVPVLAISGLALFALGWAITFLQREKPHEK